MSQTEHPRTEEYQARTLSALFEVYPTLHLSDIGLILYSGMHLSLSSGLCWWSLSSPNLGVIRGLLKLHLPQGLLIVCVISGRGLKICLSAQINPDILKYSSKEVVVGEY